MCEGGWLSEKTDVYCMWNDWIFGGETQAKVTALQRSPRTPKTMPPGVHGLGYSPLPRERVTSRTRQKSLSVTSKDVTSQETTQLLL